MRWKQTWLGNSGIGHGWRANHANFIRGCRVGVALVVWWTMMPRPCHASPLTHQTMLPFRTSTNEPLHLSADRLQMQAQPGQPSKVRAITLQGNVVVVLGKLEVRATRVVARLDSRGFPSTLQASGGVRLQLATSQGSAREARLSLAGRRTLQLAGDARLVLRDPEIMVQGRQIDLELESGQLTVQQARVSLRREVEGG